MRYNSIIEIDNFLIASEIFTEYFICDIERCHGSCCLIGDSGAPLLPRECSIIESQFENYSPFLSQKGRESIKEKGFWVVDIEDEVVTPLNGTQECAYAIFDKEGNCFCALEIAHTNGATTFMKPQSCRLYPIRCSNLSNGMTALNLHRWNLCSEAFVKGKREGVKVYQFLKNPIIAAFGVELYQKMEIADSHIKEGKIG
ncbi:MAG: DUF3109 family protein [Bacteroidales bacterium]